MADPTPTTCGHARCQPWPTCQYRRDSCPGCSALAIEVERIVSVREAAARADERERLVREVGAFAAENQVWKSTAPRGPGNASYLNGFENGRRAAGDDLRDLLDTLDQPADTKEADRG